MVPNITIKGIGVSKKRVVKRRSTFVHQKSIFPVLFKNISVTSSPRLIDGGARAYGAHLRQWAAMGLRILSFGVAAIPISLQVYSEIKFHIKI